MAGNPSSSTANTLTMNYEPIPDGQTDIATTADEDKMKVEADGRQPMQTMWLWAGSIKGKTNINSASVTTNLQYKVAEDKPEVSGLPPALPANEELVSHAAAVEYLEVGLVIGDEPNRYKKTGPSRSKEVEDERKKRGELPRDESAMRAFIPITPYVAEQAKFYIGVKLQNGRLRPRVIGCDVTASSMPARRMRCRVESLTMTMTARTTARMITANNRRGDGTLLRHLCLDAA